MSAKSSLPTAEQSQHDAGEIRSRSDGDWWLGHADWLRRLIDRRVRPLDCGDEVLQEVFVAASSSAKIPTDPSEQEPWLARVAIRQCALALRSWCRRQRREAEYVATKTAADQRLEEDPIYWLMMCERRAFVRDQLAGLESRLRDLLVLKYVKGLTYKEIAKRLNMDVAAVEYRLAEARKTLRRRLVEAGFEEGRDG